MTPFRGNDFIGSPTLFSSAGWKYTLARGGKGGNSRKGVVKEHGRMDIQQTRRSRRLYRRAMKCKDSQPPAKTTKKNSAPPASMCKSICTAMKSRRKQKSKTRTQNWWVREGRGPPTAPFVASYLPSNAPLVQVLSNEVRKMFQKAHITSRQKQTRSPVQRHTWHQ